MTKVFSLLNTTFELNFVCTCVPCSHVCCLSIMAIWLSKHNTVPASFPAYLPNLHYERNWRLSNAICTPQHKFPECMEHIYIQYVLYTETYTTQNSTVLANCTGRSFWWMCIVTKILVSVASLWNFTYQNAEHPQPWSTVVREYIVLGIHDYT